MRIFVPGDAAAVAVGADEVAAAVGPNVVRNGSRGMFELEPLLEMESDEGRIGFARVAAEDVPGILRLGRDHPACAGAAAQASRPGSSGAPPPRRRRSRNISSATPTRATAAPSPTGW